MPRDNKNISHFLVSLYCELLVLGWHMPGPKGFPFGRESAWGLAQAYIYHPFYRLSLFLGYTNVGNINGIDELSFMMVNHPGEL
jgi:hypothetical protein